MIAAYNATAGRGNGRSAEFIADDIEALQDIYGDWPGTDRVHPHDITIAQTYGREYDDLFALTNDAIEEYHCVVERANDARHAYMNA